MYRVSIVGQTNDGQDITNELGTFEHLGDAKAFCVKLNVLLRDKLRCIFRSMLEWRFDISIDNEDGTYDLYAIMDSDKDELNFDL